MTTDERISKDLAVVARVSRERPTPLEATLRKLGVLQSPAASAQPASVAAVVLLALSRVYAVRIARTASGIASVACTALLIVLACFARAIDWRDPIFFSQVAWISNVWLAITALLVVSLVYIVAQHVAWRRFRRLAVSASIDAAQRLVRSADRLSIVASIAGTLAFLLFFGMMQVTIGTNGVESLFSPGPTLIAQHLELGRWTIGFLLAAIAATVSGSLLVVRGTLLPSKLRVVLGSLVLVTTMLVGFRYDVGPGPIVWPLDMPSLPLRGCLTAAGTLGLFLIASNIALYVRAREERELAS